MSEVTATRQRLLSEASELLSDGDNPEYDRALAELIYWTTGGESIKAVAEEIQGRKAWCPRCAAVLDPETLR